MLELINLGFFISVTCLVSVYILLVTSAVLSATSFKLTNKNIFKNWENMDKLLSCLWHHGAQKSVKDSWFFGWLAGFAIIPISLAWPITYPMAYYYFKK